MHPILYDVDAAQGKMTLLYPTRPGRHRLVTLRIETPGDDPVEAARRQFHAMSDAEIERLRPPPHLS